MSSTIESPSSLSISTKPFAFNFAYHLLCNALNSLGESVSGFFLLINPDYSKTSARLRISMKEESKIEKGN